MFVKLVDADENEPLYVQPKNVAAVFKSYDGGSWVRFGDGWTLRVKEERAQIMEMFALAAQQGGRRGN